METLLQRTGLPGEGRLIVYCTGGVRSAFVAELLREIGVEAANYDASFVPVVLQSMVKCLSTVH